MYNRFMVTEQTKIRINIVHPTSSGRRTGWHKLVTSVDLTKSNGYCFEGTFLRAGLNDLPVGSVIVRQSPTGSVSRPGKDGAVLVVEADGLREVLPDTDWNTQFLIIRDAAANALASVSTPTENRLADVPTEVLLAELARRGVR